MIPVLCNDKGVTIIYIALFIFLLCAFIGLAADIGYMYVAKGQLQNASDAAALAGAAKLDGTAFTMQTSARNAAYQFAKYNLAATDPVEVSNDNSNTLSSSNDITVGHWNPAAATYTPGGTPVNAVQVRARRTSDQDTGGASIGGRVQLFFSNVIGRPEMGASATAIASRTPKAGAYFMLKQSSCTSPIASGGATIDISSGTMAWTSLLEVSTGPGSTVSDLICGNTVPNIEACSHSFRTSTGEEATTFRNMEADFYDPDYDAGNKTYVPGTSTVSTWTVIIPTTDNPTLSPSDPHEVLGYAKIRMTKVCGTPGGGNPCGGDRDFHAPPGVCAGSTHNYIVVDQIECASCENSSDLLGAKPGLVQ
ncbi:pilus assembly protein TadG-related protein [Geotalea sp. SG265]|uniref:pilus assembly protein TadG-related protein n=1 Tax=Geotalea sp. SG265 TaxID=2922867 RepID=UPI001FAED515|nr:pilus assembly protein TadG-related protein [Geotalea sp. SG265]